MFLGAITVSYNLPGVQTGLKLDGKTIADIYLGKVKTWNDAEIKALNPGVTLPSTRDHRDPPLGLLRHDGRLHRLPRRGRPRIQEQGRRRQGRAVADGHRREGQRRRRRRRPADGRRGRLRRAGLRAAAQLHLRVGQEQGGQLRRADARLDERGRAGRHGAGQPGHQNHQPARTPSAYPITSQTFIVVNKDLCKAGTPGGEAAAKGVVKFLDYGLGEGQSILSQADYAALPAAILAKSKAALAGLAVQRLADQRLSETTAASDRIDKRP